MPIVVSLAETPATAVTLEDVKIHLDIDATDLSQDDELVGFLAAAVEVVEGIVGPITPRTVTETHYGVNGGPVFLHQGPVVSVETVAGRYGSYVTADLLVDRGQGAIRTSSGYGLRGDLTVTYTAGRVDLPAAVRLAVLIIVGHLWETQRGAAPLPFGVNEVDAPVASGAGFAIPRRAQELLAPFTLGPVLA